MTSVSSSTSAYAYGDYQSRQKNLFSKLDSDQDGKLTQDEFVSGRPDDMAASQAQSLYSKLDVSGSGSISEADFTSLNYAPSQGPLAQMSSNMAVAVMSMQSSSGASTGSQKTAEEMYAAMDADGDGTLTQSEFLSARPDDVSEEQANSLYASIDTAGTGSITLEQLENSLNQQAFGGEQAEEPSSDGLATDIFSVLDADGDGKVTQDEFLSSLTDSLDEDSAKALYDLIDTSGTGSFTQEQLSDVLEANRPAGPPPSGGMSGAGGSDSETDAETVYDALDVNQDGVVSQSEFLAGKPQDVSSEDAQALYDSLDTTGTGSITQAQLADLLEELQSSLSVG